MAVFDNGIGKGTITLSNGEKFEGELKNSYPWTGKIYDEDRKIIAVIDNGEKQE